MKHISKLIGLCVAVAFVSYASAGEVEDMKKMLEDQGINYVETKLPAVKLSGYVDVSYMYNTEGGGSDATATGTPSAARVFDRDSNDFSVNAVKLALEKPLADENDWTAGFRIDTLFGEDAKYLGGNDPNNNELALEQAYVAFRIPVGNGLDFKFGKFTSILGYEVLESPANLNFSRGLLFNYALPISHVGALASYRFNDNWDAQLGIVNGWNIDDNSFWARSSKDFKKAVTGRINWTADGGNFNIANGFLISPTGEQGAGFRTAENVWVYDMWANWTPKDVDKLLLGVNFDLGQVEGLSTGKTLIPGKRDALFYGAALYAKYQFTPKFSLAGRLDYLCDEAGYRTGTQAGGPWGVGSTDDEILSWTLTAGFDLWENMLARLEYRYDTASAKVFGVNAQTGTGGSSDQHTIGVNMVYSF